MLHSWSGWISGSKGKNSKTLCWSCPHPCHLVIWAPPGWTRSAADSLKPLFSPSFSFTVFLATEVSSCFPGRPDSMTGMWRLQPQKSKFPSHCASQYPLEEAPPMVDIRNWSPSSQDSLLLGLRNSPQTLP